jgi:HSP20 family protein
MGESRKKDFAQGLLGLHQGMERLFNEMFRNATPGVYDRDQAWCPAADVYETQDGFIVKVELAGVEREQLDVAFDKGLLVVSGLREDRCSSARQSCHQAEISYGPFRRSLFISRSVDAESIKARFDSGILEIFLPKTGAGRSGRVRVEID